MFLTLDNTKKRSTHNVTIYNGQKTKEGKKINLDSNKDSEVKHTLSINYKNPVKIRNLEKSVLSQTTDRKHAVSLPKNYNTVEKFNRLNISNFENDLQTFDLKRRTQTAVQKGPSYARKHHDITNYEGCNPLEDRNTVSERTNNIKCKLNYKWPKMVGLNSK